jgi:hypothetical protein
MNLVFPNQVADSGVGHQEFTAMARPERRLSQQRLAENASKPEKAAPESVTVGVMETRR